MPQADDIGDLLVTCEGGLDNKNNFIQISQLTPGAATQLKNFEPSVFGGYRRINGFTKLDATYGEVDPTNAEGPILGVFIYDDEIYAARKQQSGTTYKIYKYVALTGWVAQTTGSFTLNTTDNTYIVSRVKYDVFSFGSDKIICFVDGVNPAYLFDGTNWSQIESANTGADFANAGGAGALDQPSLIEVYEGHLFLSGDPTAPGVVAHSAPQKEFDWVIANGSGQLVTGFNVNAIKVWRDFLYTFGVEDIGYVGVEGTDFVFKNVSTEIGCIASESVIEIDGNLIYLSQDGFRTVAGTDKINDVEIGTISKKIRKLINSLNSTYTTNDVVGYTIPSKSQVRFIWNLSSEVDTNTRGVIGGLRERIDGTQMWEWGELEGIRAPVVAVDRISGTEYIIHGDFDGFVYRQEQGNSFDGENISAVYSTPYLDFGTPMNRKTLRHIHAFMEAEGETNVLVDLRFDWGDDNLIVPPTEDIAGDENTAQTYGSGVEYGQVDVVYGAGVYPLFDKSLRGTCRSVRLSFNTSGTQSSYTIQNFIIEYTQEGRR